MAHPDYIVLDTNVLMHDPFSLFQFKEHDVVLPMAVLEELDQGKKGLSETARNVRQVSRYIDDLIEKWRGDISDGLPLDPGPGDAGGRLFFDLGDGARSMPTSLDDNKPDNAILATALAFSEHHPDRTTRLVTKDINLRIKARAIGLVAEDYSTDQVIDDPDLLYSGKIELDEKTLKTAETATDPVVFPARVAKNWYPNALIHSSDEKFQAIVGSQDEKQAYARKLIDFTSNKSRIWGIRARNMEQSFALNLLLDPEIDFVTLLGQAGTGKTLLALAAGLHQVMDEQRYSEIVATRVTVPVGEDIGFLPGTEEEKMNPWMGALDDNLEVLAPESTTRSGSWGRAASLDLIRSRIKIKSLNFMRGRTFQNRFIIIDEAQNLTAKQLKTLITRAGSGSKVICMGNLAQIDTPYLTETTSGLAFVVDRFKDWDHSGHITLRSVERSRLAD
ncbi:MAG: PhoH family protein, partial [Gammaproteobacteria bacterium]